MADDGRKSDMEEGEDLRGDSALFIEEKHFVGEWELDVNVGAAPRFFRVIKNGKQTGSHGWAEGTKVVQWG